MNECEKCGNQHNGKFGSGRFCSRQCANSRPKSDALKKRLSNKMAGYKFGNALHPIVKPVKMDHRWCSICESEFIVRSCKFNKYCSDKCARKRPGQGGYRKNSTRKIRSEYKGYWMDSGSERQFAELLDEHGIMWVKNSELYFEYKDIVGKARKYYPDFYLPEYDYWVEIKGLLYRSENDQLKLESVGTNIELQFHNELRLPKCIVL